MMPLGTEKTCRAIKVWRPQWHATGASLARAVSPWGLIRTQVLYKGIWVWRTFHEEFEVRFVLKKFLREWKRCISGYKGGGRSSYKSTVVYSLVNRSFVFWGFELVTYHLPWDVYPEISGFGEMYFGVPKITDLHFSQHGRWVHETSPQTSLSKDSLGREILSISIKNPCWWSTKKLYSDISVSDLSYAKMCLRIFTWLIFYQNLEVDNETFDNSSLVPSVRGPGRKWIWGKKTRWPYFRCSYGWWKKSG